MYIEHQIYNLLIEFGATIYIFRYLLGDQTNDLDMFKFTYCFVFLFLFFNKTTAQTTDLSIVIAAQNTSGTPISQASIYQDFQYIITIINSGAAVNNATFSQTLNGNITYINAESFNNNGGASTVSNFNFVNNTVTGTIASMPSNSNVQIKVMVKAPTSPGGIASNATISPPDGTTDNNTLNNTSIISIDITDLPIDFTVTQSQIAPAENTGISAWNDTVTYSFTITNNSSIAFPLDSFSSALQLASQLSYGTPNVQLQSFICIEGTNGMVCPTIPTLDPSIINLMGSHTFINMTTPIEFTVGGSLTFEVIYKFLDPNCGINIQPIAVESTSAIVINHTNDSPNTSNNILTPLLEANLCPVADVCIETIQLNPDPNSPLAWGELITLETTLCNNGPLEAPVKAFLQNISSNINWLITSVSCDSTTGPVSCSDFTINLSSQLWETSVFNLPANSTVTFTTILSFIEPNTCATSPPNNSEGHIRSAINLVSNELTDNNIDNNYESDYFILPGIEACEPEDFIDLAITKTQISPALPQGEDSNNTTNWGEVTYQITAFNTNANDVPVSIKDFMPQGSNTLASATLLSVDCIETTGTASCITITNANIGVLLDGEPDAGIEDTFWSITPEDNYILPAQSSVTFSVVVHWEPECSNNAIAVTNAASIANVNAEPDNNMSNNLAVATTYFAPCVDLIVQTYPQFTTVGVNQNFNWIVDITTSNTSSNAININFESILGSEFTITGTPTCSVTNGNATCTQNMTVNGNTISGLITSMDTGSTIQLIIPTQAPNFGGAFTNIAEAIPSPSDNEELTPETNISISNIQVIAPTVTKVFIPDNIIVGEQSVLEFTVTNISGNPAQNAISFTDNLPNGVVINGTANWIEDNGCTATFSANPEETAFSVTNLTFPEGVSHCTFGIPVTSQTPGIYLNNTANFSNQNNIDSSQANATLTVIEDPTDVDIEISKSVTPTEASIGDTVQFTITVANLGTTTAHSISILEELPEGYSYNSHTSTNGTYTIENSLWVIDTLDANSVETLTVYATIASSINLLNTAVLIELNETDSDSTNNEDSATVLVDDCLSISQGFSPNADLQNDTFTIKCIEDYTNNTLKIYNRYGTLVYEAVNYKNEWNGVPNKGFPKSNSLLPVGTYYYVLHIKSLQKPLIGWVYLNY